MPDRTRVLDYAMYVIGEVESRWTWNSATYFDGVSRIITIGMLQEAGTNAKRLLEFLKGSPEWATLESKAPKLASDVINLPNDWNTWAARFLTKEECEALNEIVGTDNGKRAQRRLWEEQGGGYIDAALARGFSLDRPKPLIYFMSMMHQSPAAAFAVASAAGGSADLARLHSVRDNNGILGVYDNRYNTVYNRLSAWDGESAPPDYGSIGSDGGGNDPSGEDRPTGDLSHIVQSGDMLIVYGKHGAAPFYPAGGQRWICRNRTGGSEVTGGNEGAGSSPDNAKTLDWGRARLGKWSYIFGGDRYNPDASGGTDCSGFVHAAFFAVRGIEVGDWTGSIYTSDASTTILECNTWSDVDWSKCEPGDIVLMSTDSPTFSTGNGSHVGIYTGTPKTVIDCGSTPCPTERDITWYRAIKICVRRPK